MNPYLYPHDDPARSRMSLPPQLPPSFPLQGPIGFSYPQQPFQPFQPFPLSYPLPGPSMPSQFMPQQYPPVPRPVPQSLLNDPAFSPDPRSNPHFFSMNEREEIFPLDRSDSLSDYAPTVPDDESEVDHGNLPPRMRLAAQGPQLVHHSRSQSVPYVPAVPSQQAFSRSNSARVIPVPPPISRASTPASHRRKPSPNSSSSSLSSTPGTSQVYASASVAAKELWQPPPPYTDIDSESSSSSNPQTPAGTPHSSSSHLPRDAREFAPPPVPEKRPPSQAQPQPIASSSTVPPPAPRPNDPASMPRTSAVQSTATRPPINPRNASAPELQPPPAPVDVPPRPATVPIPAPVPENVSAPQQRRRNSKNPSIATPPRDLDRIDELDESDPLGFAWHHDGPYEAIAKSTLHPDSGASISKRKQPPKRKPVQANDVSLGVIPGQIFPSFSQYQPQVASNGVQLGALDPKILPPMPPPDNFPVTSPPMSPLMLPVQRRVPPTGPSPPTPDQYSNLHMGMMNGTPAIRNGPIANPQPSRMRQPQQFQDAAPPPPRAPQRASPPQMQMTNGDAPPPSPPLQNPYSPVEEAFPNARPRRRDSSPAASRPVSMVQPQAQAHHDLPPTNVVPRPDIALPPKRQDKPATGLLPRHLPKKLVMPAPLQQSAQQNQHLPPGQAHVEFLAQRHGPHVTAQDAPKSAPAIKTSYQQQQSQSQQQGQGQGQGQGQQQGRAQDIPMSHGPNVLKKRHTTSGVPTPGPLPPQMAQMSQVPASNATAAMFAARVRFAEPPREETKEERKRREKEEARREKEAAKREKERAKMGYPQRPEIPLQGIFRPDYVKEAEIARDRELARGASAKASSSRKLSKRR